MLENNLFCRLDELADEPAFHTTKYCQKMITGFKPQFRFRAADTGRLDFLPVNTMVECESGAVFGAVLLAIRLDQHPTAHTILQGLL